MFQALAPLPDPVPAKNGRDKSPPPRVRPHGWVVPSPNCGTSSEEEDKDKDEDTRDGPPRPARGIKPAAGRSESRSASQPILESSDKEVYLDSDSDLLVLTTRPGRPAVSPGNLAAGCAQLWPLALPVSPSQNRQTTRYNKPLTQTGWY